ncbi:hypothetical protein [Haloglomus salinum]|jgi:hypothetical protein|uniref:hypothetical protein n=1 Tax=Haloglomus salinum TaxID=2962673 RepID=UPI0020CA1590|nr:hypothetical protein [Haloglomus salinum]
MSTSDPGVPENTEISTAWVVIFLLLVLGLGAAAILFTGGTLLAGGQLVVPGAF